MNNVKGLAWSAITGIIAIVGTLIVQNIFSDVEDGSDALETQKITLVVETVLEDKLSTTINGKTYTYGEALSLIHSEQVALTAAFEVLTDE